MNRIFLIIVLIGCYFRGFCVEEKVKTISQCNNDKVDFIISQLNSPTDSYVLVAAHRGDWRNAPENSIQAIKNCIEMGVDIVEIDVRMTKDSVLVLLHDTTVDRTTTGSGSISDLSLDSLNTLFLRNGCGVATRHKIPTLEEAMILAKGKILVNLDKCTKYMDLAYKVLKRTGTIEQVIFKGTKDMKQVNEKYGNLLSEIIYMPIVREDTQYLNKYVDDFIVQYKPLAFEVIFTNNNSPVLEITEILKRKGISIWVNTLWETLCGPHDDDRAIDDPNDSWGWVIKNGANIIQTDRPALLLTYLREVGLHK
jgi:glycerophosphoryl diester phosphodiesterase